LHLFDHFQQNIEALPGCQRTVISRIRFLRFLKGIELLDCFLHTHILRDQTVKCEAKDFQKLIEGTAAGGGASNYHKIEIFRL